MAQSPDRLQAVHLRHHDVHQNEIGLGLKRFDDTVFAVLRGDDLVAILLMRIICSIMRMVSESSTSRILLDDMVARQPFYLIIADPGGVATLTDSGHATRSGHTPIGRLKAR